MNDRLHQRNRWFIRQQELAEHCIQAVRSMRIAMDEMMALAEKEPAFALEAHTILTAVLVATESISDLINALQTRLAVEGEEHRGPNNLD